MSALFTRLRRVRKAGCFSPWGLLVRALMIAALYGGAELLGLRRYTSFLSGTSANLNLTWQTGALLGLVHLLLYVAFILLVPILLIAAGLLEIWNRRSAR